MKNRLPLQTLLLCLTAGALMMPAAEEEPAADSSAIQNMLDSLGLSRNDLEAQVRSTLMFGGSAPVSFSGEARVKGQYHEMTDYPRYLLNDKSYIQTGWEGNEGMLRLGMVARAGRNTTIWSKIGFQNTFAGNYLNAAAGKNISGLHDKTNDPAYIHEDMCAGLAVRTVPASFWLKMGSILWTEASPLTIWKSQPRTFAWEYLPYEIEQPIARYFEYNIAKGEKTGRAAWNKKALQGINFESINLPHNLYFNFLYGTTERFDNFEREYIDFSGDVSYADMSTAVKGKGLGDTYRHVWHGRFAANERFGGLTPALNFFSLDYKKDIITLQRFKDVFSGYTTLGGKAFYKEPKVGSFDIRGPINEMLTIHGDLAASVIDSTLIRGDTATVDNGAGQDTTVSILRTEHGLSDIVPAAYLRIESKYVVPAFADIAYIGRGFYSPLSFAAPADVFFPFGANLLGPGKFIARAEGSPYTQNMAGINLQFAPNLPGYGHLKIIYGQHLQLEKARDIIAFPYRLNGQDFFSLFHSSYNRWGNDLLDHSIPNGKKLYNKRLGDESFGTVAWEGPIGPDGGGLRSDYLAMFEMFVPYRDSSQVDSSIALNVSQDVFSQNPHIPMHKKYTFNLEVDGAYDIGPMIGFPNDFFLGFYGSLNGVTTSFSPIAFSDKDDDMLLWGTYFRFEPAVAITKKWYIVGLVGFENWRSQKAYIFIDEPRMRIWEWKPIDYRDYAYGIGFDWDMLARVGLHGRFKWMQHDDITFPANNWATPVMSTEIKMWF
ncbi:MAG: hypothetical protein JXA71_04135 [Chitinispirillaceae bacterium]|nr:hypothetical protein [Chitinispirillaceae bacterium]